MAAVAKARLLLCLCCALLALAAAQPAWPSPAADWKYLNADGSINGHYKFTYLIDGALSRFQDLTNTSVSVISFRNYSGSTSSIVVYFDSISGSCCIQPPAPTHLSSLQEEMSQNFPLIPPGAAAKGSRVVGGVLCDLFEFVWPEDNRPVQMAVASSPQWPGLVGAPVRLMLPHNGRSVEYDEFTPDARASYSDLDWAAELEAFQQSCEKRLVCQYTEAYAAESAMRPLSALR